MATIDWSKQLSAPLLTFPLDFVECVVAFLLGHLGLSAVIKRFLLNSASAKIEQNVHIYPGERFLSPKALGIGNKGVISHNVVITTNHTTYDYRAILDASKFIFDSRNALGKMGKDSPKVVRL